MGRRPRGSSASRARKGKVLARLRREEAADVLRTFLERHPELVAEAEEIARATVTDVAKNSDQVLGWAVDFPAETASQAVAMLAHESAARHRRTWRLGDALLDQVPEWAAMIKRASKPASQKR